MMTRDVVEAIRAWLGTIIHVPAQSLLGWESKIHVKVSLDVRKPIKRGLRLRSPSADELMVSFTYEKLHTFCYGCGVLGHILRDCASSLEELDRGEERGELQYGAWLRETRGIEQFARAGEGVWGRNVGGTVEEGGYQRSLASGGRRGPAIFDGGSRGGVRNWYDGKEGDSGAQNSRSTAVRIPGTLAARFQEKETGKSGSGEVEGNLLLPGLLNDVVNGPGTRDGPVEVEDTEIGLTDVQTKAWVADTQFTWVVEPNYTNHLKVNTERSPLVEPKGGIEPTCGIQPMINDVISKGPLFSEPVQLEWNPQRGTQTLTLTDVSPQTSTCNQKGARHSQTPLATKDALEMTPKPTSNVNSGQATETAAEHSPGKQSKLADILYSRQIELSSIQKISCDGEGRDIEQTADGVVGKELVVTPFKL